MSDLVLSQEVEGHLLYKRIEGEKSFRDDLSNVINIDNRKCSTCHETIGGEGNEILEFHKKRCKKSKPALKYPMKCNICEIRFKDAKGLAMHMMISIGHYRNLPLFRCSFCFERFSKLSILIKHTFVKHKKTTSQLKCTFSEDEKGPPTFFYEL